jgi:hypothetical protein
MESVATFVERYFEWTAVFSGGSPLVLRSPVSLRLGCLEEHESADVTRTRHKMKLYRIDRYADGIESSWWEVLETGRRTVRFLWET